MSTTTTKDKVDATKKSKSAKSASAAVTNLGPSFDPFDTSDPFGGASGAGTPSLDANVGSKENKIHIRLQQRNGRKTLTTVQGLPDKYDPKKLLKAMKKEFACNGTVVSSADSGSDDEGGPDAGDAPAAPAAGGKSGKGDFGQVLQFQGDQRVGVKEFLVKAGLYSEKEAKDKIVIHGY